MPKKPQFWPFNIKYMKTLLKELDAKKAELAALQPMKPADAERLWKKFRLEWNYNSNHIEGNTLTYQETELMLIFDQAPTGNHTVREIEEMKAHDVAIELVREWAVDKTRELSETDIRNLNRTLLVRPFWNEAMTPDGQLTRRLISIGEYKKHPNSVKLSNGEMFHYVSPEETPLKMDELLTWYRQAAQELHPAIVAAKLHYDFVRIHPFDDGNGRVSRLLMNYHLLRYGFPPVIIKSDDKKNYLAALNRADVGDFEAFAMYVAEQVLWSLELSISAAKGESVEEEGDWEKQVELLRRDAEEIKSKAGHKKMGREEAIANWLTRNFPILLKEMEVRVGVLGKFFEHQTMTISAQNDIQTSPPVRVDSKDYDWRLFVTGDTGHSRIMISYEFRKFKYELDKKNKLLKSLPLIINIQGDKVYLSSLWSNITKIEFDFQSNLAPEDLQPIRDLAMMFYDQIQAAITK